MFVASDTNVTRNPAETYSLVSGVKLDEKVCIFTTIECLEYKCSIIASEVLESQQMTYVVSFKSKQCSRASRIAVSSAVNIDDTGGNLTQCVLEAQTKALPTPSSVFEPSVYI